MGIADTKKLLDLMYLQIGAEAFLSSSATTESLATDLKTGNKHNTRMLESEAQYIANNYKVVAVMDNTSTGFSGTIFEDALGNLTISLRSTEFIDDSVRDSQATNYLEISDHGFAVGQISDMVGWLSNLPEDVKNKLSLKGATVTGYSLGGHLAGALAMYNDKQTPPLGFKINEIYTFNGAGVGSIQNSSLNDVINTFNMFKNDGKSIIDNAFAMDRANLNVTNSLAATGDNVNVLTEYYDKLCNWYNSVNRTAYSLNEDYLNHFLYNLKALNDKLFLHLPRLKATGNKCSSSLRCH